MKKVTSLDNHAYKRTLPPPIYEAIERWAEDEAITPAEQIEMMLMRGLYKAGRLPRGFLSHEVTRM